jgi:cellulose synthase/poly-beta-1,6-N-acetylglucosamine synthase-like glycosyltransferase
MEAHEHSMHPSTLTSPQVDPSDVAIIVPVGGAAPAWSRCAHSLTRLDPAPGEVVAVIDGPNEDQAKKAAEIGARVVVLEKQGGPARARNRGVQAASRDILLFIDADVEVPTHLIAQVVEIFSANRNVSAVMGSYDDAPSDPGFVSQYRNLLHHFVHQNGREMASTFWAGCGAIRREAFREVGGFDECYSDPSIEDIELGSRLRQAGHTIHLVKDLQVKHMKTWRLADMLSTDLTRRAIPWTELMLRDGRMVNDLNVKTRDRISVVMAFVAVFALLSAWIWPPLLATSALAMILMVALNGRLFRFYQRERGILFTAGVIPLYVLYLWISGLGFMLGVIRYFVRRK